MHVLVNDCVSRTSAALCERADVLRNHRQCALVTWAVVSVHIFLFCCCDQQKTLSTCNINVLLKVQKCCVCRLCAISSSLSNFCVVSQHDEQPTSPLLNEHACVISISHDTTNVSLNTRDHAINHTPGMQVCITIKLQIY